MAESTLSITYAELRREIGRFLGYGRDTTVWTADQITDVADCLKGGLRKFYYPPGLDHEWGFLRISATLSLSNGDYDYDLPDAFSGVIVPDSLAYNAGDGRRTLEKIKTSRLIALQSQGNASGVPKYYSVRAKTHAPTTGHRWEALFYPTPDSSYTIRYQYIAAPDTIDATNIYPIGGAIHSETILQACLAKAEEMLDDGEGVHAKKFLECLAASVRADKAQKIQLELGREAE